MDIVAPFVKGCNREGNHGEKKRGEYKVKEREGSPHFISFEKASMIADTSDLIFSSMS